MNISPARIAAFDILFRIETEKAFSSALLPLFEENLSTRDRGLCHELTLGTLRRQIYLDRYIDTFSAGKKLDIEVRLTLRIALYQLYFLTKIPQYSAINESVNLVQRARKTSAKGFVNAILRRAVKERPELHFIDDIDRISVETSHPRWLIEKWSGDFGIDETARIAAANNEVPTTAFRMVGTASEMGEAIASRARRSEYVEGCFIADLDERQLFDLADSGQIYIQDEASQMVAKAVKVSSGERFLDVCAAPGGKTTLIALGHAGPGVLIAAGDKRRSRLEFLRENCRRQGVSSVKIIEFDAEWELPFAEGSFDVVLVDAPCSGTGTIRRNPEIRYFLNLIDFADLFEKQLSILENASKLVRTGGLVIYSTCSLESEENEAVCRRFLGENPEFIKVMPSVSEAFITDDGFGRTWPQRDNMDGFFIAAFQRRKAGNASLRQVQVPCFC